jgi:hypothetical protein
MSDHEPVGVKVTNFEEMVFRTEEKEPEHFAFTTVTLIPGQASQQLLAHDPLRKDASILPIDAPIVLCDSPAQSNSAANQAAGIPAPDGAYVPQGTPVGLSGTGQVLGACSVATRVSIVINRRSV